MMDTEPLELATSLPTPPLQPAEPERTPQAHQPAETLPQPSQEAQTEKAELPPQAETVPSQPTEPLVPFRFLTTLEIPPLVPVPLPIILIPPNQQEVSASMEGQPTPQEQA
ncbi:MAG: hypothetical protein LBU27_03790 [Candidatus Peribacteria bacterium]|nr:hypothetical protein [Candidatus Peribacteria bacterium]